MLGTLGECITLRLEVKAKAQHAQWNLNEIEKKFQRDLHRVKEYASGIQNIFCLKS